MAKQYLELDKLQRTDHDTLIRVESKVDGLVADIKNLKDGTNIKSVEYEGRIKYLEKVVEAAQPDTRVKQIDELIQWKHDFQLTWKTTLGFAGGIGAVVSFILMTTTYYFNLIN